MTSQEDTIAVLRQAAAPSQHEPVAWQARAKVGNGNWFQVEYPTVHDNPEHFDYRPLYLSAAGREALVITEEMVEAGCAASIGNPTRTLDANVRAILRAALALTPAVAPDGAGEALSDLPRTIDTIENAYAFECEAGPLKNCGEWKYLKRIVAALAQAQEPGKDK